MSANIFPAHTFLDIASAVYEKGYCVLEDALPIPLLTALQSHLQNESDLEFKAAGVGRGLEHVREELIRQDQIAWIEGESAAEQQWLDWAALLKVSLNQQLFLGLFAFESHFAHYRIGQFYKRHHDAFRGQANRVLSIVTYLNKDWQDSEGGELIIYSEDGATIAERVYPRAGTVVVFLSEAFAHEVLPSTRDRYSIAGWFRVNQAVL